MLNIAQGVQNATEHAPYFLDWASNVIVPIALAFIGKITWTAHKNAKEAAYSVRPNGSGHGSITEMLEDALNCLHKLDGKVTAHIESEGHPDMLRNFGRLEQQIDDLIEKIEK